MFNQVSNEYPGWNFGDQPSERVGPLVGILGARLMLERIQGGLDWTHMGALVGHTRLDRFKGVSIEHTGCRETTNPVGQLYA